MSSTDPTKRITHDQSSMYDLQIITFHHGYDINGIVKPYHWAFLVAGNPRSRSIVYQLHGMPGNFEYQGPEDEAVLDSLENRQKELDIGRVPATELTKLELLLARIPVSRVEYGYNCQTWTRDALQIMESCGWLDYPCCAVVQWLERLEEQDTFRGIMVNPPSGLTHDTSSILKSWNEG